MDAQTHCLQDLVLANVIDVLDDGVAAVRIRPVSSTCRSTPLFPGPAPPPPDVADIYSELGNSR